MEDVSTPNPKVDVRNLAIDDVEANPWNPNEQDEATFDRLVHELDTVGFIDPIQVVPMKNGKYRILGGEHRWTAAKVLGWTEIPAVVLSDAKWADEDLQKFVTTRLNMLRGKMNPDKFLKMYDEMAGKYGDESLQSLFAYTDEDAWKKLLKDIGKGLKNSLPPDLAKKFDEVKGEVKTVEGLSETLNQLFTQYGNTLKYNFMVFTHGGQDHVYVQMNKDTKKSVNRILEACQENEQDINDVIGESLQKAAAMLKDA